MTERTQAIYLQKPPAGQRGILLVAVAFAPEKRKKFSLTSRDYYEVYKEAARWLADETGLAPLDAAADLAVKHKLKLKNVCLVTGWGEGD